MTYAVAAKEGSGGQGGAGLMKAKNSKLEEVRKSNIQAARALAETVRTSLGPRYCGNRICDILIDLFHQGNGQDDPGREGGVDHHQ